MRAQSLSLAAALALLAMGGAQAAAAEIWGGLYAHDIRDGLSEGGYEDGVQLAAGVVSRPIDRFSGLGRPSAFALGALSTDEGTSYAAAGLSWRLALTPRAYLRPGLGLAVHDGETDLPSPYQPGLTSLVRNQRFARGQEELDLGSRVLAHLQLAVGWQASERWAVEASWLHLSHGGVAGDHNPGLSDLGLRLVYTHQPR